MPSLKHLLHPNLRIKLLDLGNEVEEKKHTYMHVRVRNKLCVYIIFSCRIIPSTRQLIGVLLAESKVLN